MNINSTVNSNKLTINTGAYKEHTLSINEFNRPLEFYGPKAIITKIIELIMMNPGTYPTRPYMGVGLIKNYRNTFMRNIGEIQEVINNQIQTYLPEFSGVHVTLLSGDSTEVLFIFIEINDTSYSVSLDVKTKTLKYISG